MRPRARASRGRACRRFASQMTSESPPRRRRPEARAACASSLAPRRACCPPSTLAPSATDRWTSEASSARLRVTPGRSLDRTEPAASTQTPRRRVSPTRASPTAIVSTRSCGRVHVDWQELRRAGVGQARRLLLQLRRRAALVLRTRFDALEDSRVEDLDYASCAVRSAEHDLDARGRVGGTRDEAPRRGNISEASSRIA